MADPNRIELEIGGEDAGAGDLIERLVRRIDELERAVARLSGEAVDLPTEPAEADVKRLATEFAKLERAFERAQRAVDFARARHELEGTAASARRLANAEATLAARGKLLIDFSRQLPPELQRSAFAMDRLEKQTEQAAAAFRKFQASAGAARRGFSDLVSSINGLKAGLAGVIAALGIQQFAQLGRRLVGLSAEAIGVKREFDRLEPALRGLLGSTDLAGESIEFLQKTSADLKVATSALISPYVQLTAAVRETGLSLEENDRVFKAVVESGRAFGLSSEQVGRALTAVSQIAGKSVFSMEELRQQLGEAIPNAIPALAKGLGVTVAEAIERVSDGALTAAEGLPALSRGLEELNQAAARNQLETLAAQLDEVGRLAELAQKSFADGLAPGLREALQAAEEFLAGSQELFRFLGDLAGTLVADATKEIKAFVDAARGIEKVTGGLISFADALRDIAEVAPIGGEALGRYADRLEGITDKGEAAFKKIADEAAATTDALGRSARETEAHYREAFEATTKNFGLSAADILELSNGLASDLAEASEKQSRLQEKLLKATVDAQKKSAEERIRIEERVAEFYVKLAERTAEDQEAIFEKTVAAARRIAAARVQAEADAAEEIRALLEETVAAAQEAAEERIAADKTMAVRVGEIHADLALRIGKLREDEALKLAAQIEKIELELQEKLAALRSAAAEELAKEGAKREEIAKDLAEKVIELERDAAAKITAAQQSIAEASERAAERRIQAEQRVREEYEKSLEKLTDIIDKLNEAVEEGEDRDSPLSKLEEEARDAAEALEDLKGQLEGIFGDVGEQTDPGKFLEEGFADAEQLLGGAASGFGSYTEALDQAGESTEEVRDFTEELQDAIEGVTDSIGTFDEITQDSLRSLVDRFGEVAESGNVTRDELSQFTRDLEQILEPAGQAGEAVAEIGKGAEGVGKVADELGRAGEAAADTAQQIVELEDGTKLIVNAGGELAESLGVSAEATRGLGEAASEAAEPVERIGEAAEKLREPLVGEDEPEKLRALGEAAAEAQPVLEGIAEPAAQVAESTAQLAETLPAISEALPVIAETVGNLIGILAESPVDLEALAAQVQALADPLTAVSESLPVISASVTAILEPAQALQELAEPLLALVAEAAEDERFLRIGEGLAAMAEALPKIPEPLTALREALEALADRGSDITSALQGAAEGLTAISADDLLERLAKLASTLEGLPEVISEASSATESWKGAVEELLEAVPQLDEAAGSLGETLRSDLVPALSSGLEQARGFAEALQDLKAAADEAAEAIVAMAEKATEAMANFNAQVRTAIENVRELIAEMQELAAAASAVQLP